MTNGIRTKTVTLITLLALSVIIGILHHSAISNHWYWLYWWFDILMHILGGFLIVAGTIWVIDSLSSYGQGVTRRIKFTYALIALLFVSIGWEVFEFYAGVSFADNYVKDTILDLFMDSFGGILALFFYMCNVKKPQQL